MALLKLKHFLKAVYYRYFKPTIKCDCLILDDIYPQLMSAFRIVEYSYYLDSLNSVVLSSATSFSYVSECRNFSEVREDYYQKFPTHRNKVHFFHPSIKVKAKLAYFIFLNNGLLFLDFIEKNKLPFIFTLYPGGGLRLYDEYCTNNLRKIFSSKYFEGVIVTQKPILQYLKFENLCGEDKIKYLPGGPINILENDSLLKTKKRFPVEKMSFDICFVAAKYSSQGKDKGYDTFIEVAKTLNKTNKNIYFHVVGGFTPNDINVEEISNFIQFYGGLKTEDLHEFYTKMDIILSPNISNVLYKGAFDGFPTGCVAEAAGCDVLMMVYDDLDQNIIYVNGIDIEILDRNIDYIVDRINYFYQHPEEMYSIGTKGRLKTVKYVSIENQMQPRADFINSIILN